MRCFFIGHRHVNEEIYAMLFNEIVRHIEEYGVNEFAVGSYGRFDALAAKAVINAKKEFSYVRLLNVMHYYHYKEISLPQGFDGYLYPSESEMYHRRYSIVQGNQYMVRNSSYLICYVTHTVSNAKKILEYAKARERKGKIHVVNLSDKTEVI